jgi:HK97 family phage major capsid protein
MPTLQELRDKRAAAWANAQEYNQRTDMSAEDETAWKRALDEVDELGAQIENRERTEKLDQRFGEIDDETNDRAGGRPSDGTGGDGASLDDEYRKAFVAYMRYGLDEIEPEQRKLVRSHFRADPALRAQGAGTGSAGGFTVPEGFWAKVTETMKFFGGVLQAGVETLDTASGEAIPWPTNDDTANKGALLAENAQVTEQDLTFGQAQLDAFMYTSRLVRVSIQLLQDSGIDVESFLARKLGERLGRIFNEHWTTGTGAAQPQGFVTGATVGVAQAGTATSFGYNHLVDLVHSVDAAYRNGPGVGFSMHDLILAFVRKIRDDSGGAGIGRPIWEPSIQEGKPDTLLGYPVTVNNDMASVQVNTARTLAFGNFRAAYVARRVRGAQTLRLAERYADFLQVGFLGFQRADGVTQDASAVKVLVNTT